MLETHNRSSLNSRRFQTNIPNRKLIDQGKLLNPYVYFHHIKQQTNNSFVRLVASSGLSYDIRRRLSAESTDVISGKKNPKRQNQQKVAKFIVCENQAIFIFAASSLNLHGGSFLQPKESRFVAIKLPFTVDSWILLRCVASLCYVMWGCIDWEIPKLNEIKKHSKSDMNGN